MDEEKKITEDKGVVMPKGSKVLKKIIKDDIEGGKLKEGFEVRQVPPVVVWDLNDALAAYKENELPIVGRGKDRGYELAGTLGVAGVLGFLVGGALLAKGKTALGAVGLGAGAGLEVGAYATLPKKVPLVGYYYGVRDDVVEHTKYPRYVFVKLPLKLSDEAFEVRSKAQIRQRIKENDFKVPSPVDIEMAIAREEHKDEVESNGSPGMSLPPPDNPDDKGMSLPPPDDPDNEGMSLSPPDNSDKQSKPDNKGIMSDEGQEDVLKQKEKASASSSLSPAIIDKSSMQIFREHKGSGITTGG